MKVQFLSWILHRKIAPHFHQLIGVPSFEQEIATCGLIALSGAHFGDIVTAIENGPEHFLPALQGELALAAAWVAIIGVLIGVTIGG